ncbi:hypothetical protein MCOR27_005000 [Pyricularia oryzae]|uniref:Uncharacterized protein n=1 Tax=Pyricularia grisea TaxID=148305 RepID=A0ABQ8NVX3_PYRGI|nr:hypothetical protein MCOR01_009454 [Pyricularia oryzae]KAI6301564.1 hypothetical protein MCOR33_002958 [Pyricularia grisea]KAI6261232.1 hypothetical protein MCOR19_002531 [Pyricularia oryzae]KAI6279281.1 hypothetical protein MCOR26_004237 [Pyricularia oryzae]KAI6279747.1 hypothetical protein MCOR27_005000 [Pyricularia oryzae]
MQSGRLSQDFLARIAAEFIEAAMLLYIEAHPDAVVKMPFSYNRSSQLDSYTRATELTDAGT